MYQCFRWQLLPAAIPPCSLLLCNRPLCSCDLHSFPTRRSSDLIARASPSSTTSASFAARTSRRSSNEADRKSTRLNSSHLVISYAVFCLKKKTATNGVVFKDE